MSNTGFKIFAALLLLCSVMALSPAAFATPEVVSAGSATPVESSETTTTNEVPVPAKSQPVAVSRDNVLNPGTDNNSAMTLTKIVISLALVILLVLGLGWMFKKLSLRMPGNRQIKVICALPLGQRERILVIEIQGKQRVIGVTPQSINLLFELENPLPEEKLASDFHTQLQSFLKK